MAEMKGRKKRLSINLSFLTLSDSRKRPNARYSPTHFEGPNGVVGLGILAAMKDDRLPHQDHFLNSGAALAISPKSASNSIPMIKKKNSSENSSCKKISAAKMKGFEEYTCVISHVGQNLVKKREYFDAEILGTNDGCAGVLTGNGGCSAAETGGAETAAFEEAGFLSSCILCDKKLHGLDVFMYRGDKAFCSAECRWRQMWIDEHREKWHSKARKGRVKHSVSSCSVAAVELTV